MDKTIYFPLLLKLNKMFASTKWQFFVFNHKMAAVALSLHKTWLPWYDAENDQEKDARDGKQMRGRKKEKEGFPASFISSILHFTRSGKTENIADLPKT